MLAKDQNYCILYSCTNGLALRLIAVVFVIVCA
jgi:hypothetical protein